MGYLKCNNEHKIRNKNIFKETNKGTSLVSLARLYGISVSRVAQIRDKERRKLTGLKIRFLIMRMLKFGISSEKILARYGYPLALNAAMEFLSNYEEQYKIFRSEIKSYEMDS